MTARTRRWTTFALVVGVAAAILVQQAPGMLAGALLHPERRTAFAPQPEGCSSQDLPGQGITLRGWVCSGGDEPRATIVFLHGVADNRSSGVGIVERYLARGFDVVAYDSRAHGESEGAACTYGVHERRDLRRVLDSLDRRSIVLVGTSLGAAVALQEAPDDPRIQAIVAAEVFSDLETVARDRLPGLLPEWIVRRAIAVAEERGGFRVADASPVAAARRIRIPVLLVHGDDDRETPPSHAERVHDALDGPKRLLLVPGAGHNESLASLSVWDAIDEWIDGAL